MASKIQKCNRKHWKVLHGGLMRSVFLLKDQSSSCDAELKEGAGTSAVKTIEATDISVVWQEL